jgi:hypothetical protein
VTRKIESRRDISSPDISAKNVTTAAMSTTLDARIATLGRARSTLHPSIVSRYEGTYCARQRA